MMQHMHSKMFLISKKVFGVVSAINACSYNKDVDVHLQIWSLSLKVQNMNERVVTLHLLIWMMTSVHFYSIQIHSMQLDSH